MHELLPQKDPLGQAALDYLTSKKSRDIRVSSDLAEDDVIPSEWLFRDFTTMPAVEQAALKACRGMVLDVGAGAGSHALWLQENGVKVSALEISELCCQVMRQRGVATVINQDIAALEGKWDTVLFMMNGLGIGGDPAGVVALLSHCRTLLNPGGQILFDSTDVSYLYEDEDIGPSEAGPGQFRFTMGFGDCQGESFPWIYLDPDSCWNLADAAGLQLEMLEFDEASHGWLGRLTVK